MPKTKAIKAIEQALTDAVNRIGPDLQKSLLQSYQQVAETGLAELIENAQDPERKGRLSSYERWSDNVRRYITRDPKTLQYQYQSWNITWESLRETPEVYMVDAYQVKKSAEQAYEHAVESFVGKNLSKFQSILGNRDDLVDFTVDIEMRRGLLVGPVTLQLSDAEVHGDLSLKYVMRTVPRYTPYFQYPLVFTQATIRGQEHRRPSEDELAELLAQ